MACTFRVGCAGWSLRKEHAGWFGAEGTHLVRYATRFNCVEINSSFYRPHRTSTYERWAEVTPDHFRFSVKLPKEVTHKKRLKKCSDEVDRFATEVGGLRHKLGVVLVQLPPSLIYDATVAVTFFDELTGLLACPIVVEPRHASWFADAATSMLVAGSVGRVVADPPIEHGDGAPVNGDGLAYFRWHGSPRIYYSSYDGTALAALKSRLRKSAASNREVWCVFDNTAEGAATENAVALQRLLGLGATA
jgi:uncharacterized protein YecE (DUF72 family)